MKLRSGSLISALGIALAALLASDPATVGAASPGSMSSVPHPVWSEVKWPFLLDEWGIGRAFRCGRADCGIEVDLYLRAKVGFCNCATGVSDNADLDRVSDLELFSQDFVGLTDGRPVRVGRMQGRSRLYHVTIPYAARATWWPSGSTINATSRSPRCWPIRAGWAKPSSWRSIFSAPIRFSVGLRRSSAGTASDAICRPGFSWHQS